MAPYLVILRRWLCEGLLPAHPADFFVVRAGPTPNPTAVAPTTSFSASFRGGLSRAGIDLDAWTALYVRGPALLVPSLFSDDTVNKARAN
jgi:hypothetical protein